MIWRQDEMKPSTGFYMLLIRLPPDSFHLPLNKGLSGLLSLSYDRKVAMLVSCQWEKEQLEKDKGAAWFHVSTADRAQRVGPQMLFTFCLCYPLRSCKAL